jgi:haloacetate dehalogenase
MGRLDPQRKAPLLRVLGSAGTVGALYNVLETRREKALDRGHSLEEERPDQFLRRCPRKMPFS